MAGVKANGLEIRCQNRASRDDGSSGFENDGGARHRSRVNGLTGQDRDHIRGRRVGAGSGKETGLGRGRIVSYRDTRFVGYAKDVKTIAGCRIEGARWRECSAKPIGPRSNDCGNVGIRGVRIQLDGGRVDGNRVETGSGKQSRDNVGSRVQSAGRRV